MEIEIEIVTNLNWFLSFSHTQYSEDSDLVDTYGICLDIETSELVEDGTLSTLQIETQDSIKIVKLLVKEGDVVSCGTPIAFAVDEYDVDDIDWSNLSLPSHVLNTYEEDLVREATKQGKKTHYNKP